MQETVDALNLKIAQVTLDKEKTAELEQERKKLQDEKEKHRQSY